MLAAGSARNATTGFSPMSQLRLLLPGLAEQSVFQRAGEPLNHRSAGTDGRAGSSREGDGIASVSPTLPSTIKKTYI